MTATPVQPDITELLERTGAVSPRGGRGKWTCPECKRPSLSVSTDKGLFHCFHAGCDFQGSVSTLRNRLGLRREWLPRGVYLRLRREHERADYAAQWLYATIRARRIALQDDLDCLARIEVGAQADGPDRAEVWNALELVYRQRPSLLAELMILENCCVQDLVRFLTANENTRETTIDRVIAQGGLYDFRGRFVEVTV